MYVHTGAYGAYEFPNIVIFIDIGAWVFILDPRLKVKRRNPYL